MSNADRITTRFLIEKMLTGYTHYKNGSGLPFSSELPNGWSIRFSACPVLNVDKQHTEFGIDPDVNVSITAQAIQKGRDTLIDAAIERLLTTTDKSQDK